ncbi:uncharacterized protein LOC142981685 [Anticarsia gemmatalis]|uniref:uncharacterized protein LOC142981685 n=1 Tax=Anticarsia gemmatalis TaxID=129554 RepID=UPI003F772066
MQFIRALVEATLSRIVQARRYRPAELSLRSQLVLLRAANTHVSSLQQLKRLSRQPLAIHQLRAPLAQSAYDMRVPPIINKYLSNELLSAFDKHNFCDTYLIDNDVFILALPEE